VTDNITLPRAFVEEMRELIRIAFYNPYGSEFRNPYKHQQAALTALAAALAEPETVAVDLGKEGSDKTVISFITLPAAAKPEPATHEQVFAAYSAGYRRYWTQYQAGWHEAERFHGIRGDKT